MGHNKLQLRPEVMKVVHFRREHQGEVVPRMVVLRLDDEPHEPVINTILLETLRGLIVN